MARVDLVNHETAHATAALMLGWRTVAVSIEPMVQHGLEYDGWHRAEQPEGLDTDEYLEQRAVVVLAGLEFLGEGAAPRWKQVDAQRLAAICAVVPDGAAFMAGIKARLDELWAAPLWRPTFHVIFRGLEVRGTLDEHDVAELVAGLDAS